MSGHILIVQRDQVLLNRSYGYANRELPVPNSKSTHFGIASITKLFTDVIINLLKEEGKLNLSDPVEKYLAGIPKGPDGGIPSIENKPYDVVIDGRIFKPAHMTSAINE